MFWCSSLLLKEVYLWSSSVLQQQQHDAFFGTGFIRNIALHFGWLAAYVAQIIMFCHRASFIIHCCLPSSWMMSGYMYRSRCLSSITFSSRFAKKCSPSLRPPSVLLPRLWFTTPNSFHGLKGLTQSYLHYSLTIDPQIKGQCMKGSARPECFHLYWKALNVRLIENASTPIIPSKE